MCYFLFNQTQGQLSSNEPKTQPADQQPKHDRKGTDGWDTEEWGSLEEEPVSYPSVT